MAGMAYRQGGMLVWMVCNVYQDLARFNKTAIKGTLPQMARGPEKINSGLLSLVHAMRVGGPYSMPTVPDSVFTSRDNTKKKSYTYE